jgi:catechol 2,3-dioxygenase-like lactoylglutathione lyase family enzyme
VARRPSGNVWLLQEIAEPHRGERGALRRIRSNGGRLRAPVVVRARGQDQAFHGRERSPRARRSATPTTSDRKEVTMSTTQLSTIPSPPEGQDLATVPMKFEVTPIPVTDFDRAKAFYQRLGWRLDIDLQFTEQVRAVQFTPPGSPASIQFGPAGADRLQRLLLIVDDIEAARTELAERGIDVSEIFHALPGEAPEPGRDPQGRSYVSQSTFSDPDGNQWVLQEVTQRIPGRV